MKRGMLAGVFYIADLSEHTKMELTEMTPAVFAAEKIEVAEVLDYVEEIVLGAEGCPGFQVAASTVKVFIREALLRADKLKQYSHCEGALAAKEIVVEVSALCAQ